MVVGARPEELLAQGFKPVGKDFPVFLHPETHEEYALARTERKTGAAMRSPSRIRAFWRTSARCA